MEDKERNKLIAQIFTISESLTLNASSIIGDEKCLKSVKISFELGQNLEPEIVVKRTFLPEKRVEIE